MAICLRSCGLGVLLFCGKWLGRNASKWGENILSFNFPLPLLPSLVPITNLLFLLFPANSRRYLNDDQFHRLLLLAS